MSGDEVSSVLDDMLNVGGCVLPLYRTRRQGYLGRDAGLQVEQHTSQGSHHCIPA
jgi:hypothetical protein